MSKVRIPQGITAQQVTDKLHLLSKLIDKAVKSSDELAERPGPGGGLYLSVLDAFVKVRGGRELNGIAMTLGSEFSAWREFPPEHLRPDEVRTVMQGLEQAECNVVKWFGDDGVLQQDEYDRGVKTYATRPRAIGTFVAPSVLGDIIDAMIYLRRQDRP